MFRKAKKRNLIEIARELRLPVEENMLKADLEDLIYMSEDFKTNPDDVKDLMESIVADRKEEDDREAEKQRLEVEKQRLELEKLKLEQMRFQPEQMKFQLELIEAQQKLAEAKNNSSSDYVKSENTDSVEYLVSSVKILAGRIPTRAENWGLFFSSLERAFVMKNVPDRFKAEILINILGEKASSVLIYVKDSDVSNYEKVKEAVLREFEPSPQVCLDNFRKARKGLTETCVQFASRLALSFGYYLKLRGVDDFESLKDLMISDKLMETLSQETASHIALKQGNKWFTPTQLAEECDIFTTSRGKTSSLPTPSRNTRFYDKKNAPRVFFSDSRKECFACRRGSHALKKCYYFLKLSPVDRSELIRKAHLCFRCFSSDHSVRDCNSGLSCEICRRDHHTLLCFKSVKTLHDRPQLSKNEESLRVDDVTAEQTVNEVYKDQSGSQFVGTSSSEDKVSKMTLLSTVICLVKDYSDNYIPCRALLDVGSMSHFITKECADRLQLKKRKINIAVSCLNDSSMTVNYRINTIISNDSNSFRRNIELFMVNKITDIYPSGRLSVKIENRNDLPLADPNFDRPGKIDLLIGAEIFYELLKPGQFHQRENNLILQNTVFGYVVSGSVPRPNTTLHCGVIQDADLNETMEKFWKIEDVEESQNESSEEVLCEQHFMETHRRESDGKYVVNLPFKENCLLGSSTRTSHQRLLAVWRKLGAEPAMAKLYSDFMTEYEELGHMKEVSSDAVEYVIPHLGVYRPESSTTKLRVVFDASAPSSTGLSLNDCLMKGGLVQEDLFAILLRFRKYKVAFAADVKKMYRQIWVEPAHCKHQTIMWKEGPTAEVKYYKLLTVTYGTSCAPYLATRVLKQLALDEKDRFPLASAVTLTDFYVDDILTGARDVPTAVEIQRQLIAMLKSGGMDLHKWSSNESELMRNVPLCEQEYRFGEDYHYSVKTLGLKWDPGEDVFSFAVSMVEEGRPTKRSILSVIARLFDPLGLLGPVISAAKILLQKLWSLKIGWDQDVPSEVGREWKRFSESLQYLQDIRIQRFISIRDSGMLEIHGFSDASKDAYGAVIYLRCTTKSDTTVELLCSKSRVAPLKSLTIPRLELCGAELLSRLVVRVLDSLKLPISKVFLYCDSTIVLSWISMQPSKLKVFVSNRISRIQALSNDFEWCHVPSGLNPADLLSRGLPPERLLDNQLWWNGPDFLSLGKYIPSFRSKPQVEEELELVDPEIRCHLTTKTEFPSFMGKYSSWSKLNRVIAYCKRFLNNCTVSEKLGGFLSAAELKAAEKCIIRVLQASEFGEELDYLKKGKSLKSNCKLLSLNPFIDSDGVLRVGGRLKNANISESQRHPVILPKKHAIVDLIIRYFHVKYMHAAPQLLLCLLRQNFWIISGRSVVRRIVHQCVICCRHRGKLATQMMSDLPESRVTISRPFHNTGVDFAGPFMIKHRTGRGQKKFKCYVSVFVCFSTRAVHLEVVEDLSTGAFLEALKRFMARRGKPACMYSDCGTNFKGAYNEINRCILQTQKDSTFASYLASEGVRWNFNPPSAPHFGGLWESSVKSMKVHLRRAVGSASLTYPEFVTLITQIEACMNSRPLSSMSDDPLDLGALTPGHLLIGEPLTALPEEDLSKHPLTYRERWRVRQALFQHFWKRWSVEYLTQLQQRPKWRKPEKDIRVDDLVLIKDDNAPPLMWKMGRVVKLHPGSDARVRVVTVRTSTGLFQRPIVKLCLLPVNL